MTEDMLYKAIGYLIRSAREEAKLTQADLARIVGLTRTSITNIETGRQKVQIHTLYNIAEALRVSLLDLLPNNSQELSDGYEEQLEDLPKAEREWVKQILNREV